MIGIKGVGVRANGPYIGLYNSALKPSDLSRGVIFGVSLGVIFGSSYGLKWSNYYQVFYSSFKADLKSDEQHFI